VSSVPTLIACLVPSARPECTHVPGTTLIGIAVIGRVLRSWSDSTTIPRSARCLLDGFDPAGMFLLFPCRNRISVRLTPIRGSSGSGRLERRDRPRLGRDQGAASIGFLLLSEGLRGNTLKPNFNTAMEAWW
jgi:hypothetical protein